MNRDLNQLQPGDTVRYSVSANKHYGIAKQIRARNGVVKEVSGDWALVLWKGIEHPRRVPLWALALYWRPGMDGRAA